MQTLYINIYFIKYVYHLIKDPFKDVSLSMGLTEERLS